MSGDSGNSHASQGLSRPGDLPAGIHTAELDDTVVDIEADVSLRSLKGSFPQLKANKHPEAEGLVYITSTSGELPSPRRWHPLDSGVAAGGKISGAKGRLRRLCLLHFPRSFIGVGGIGHTIREEGALVDAWAWWLVHYILGLCSLHSLCHGAIGYGLSMVSRCGIADCCSVAVGGWMSSKFHVVVVVTAAGAG